ncbi:Valyl-tRNA synthetase [hydrothermal vent metagenome]|uniref:valine--tRNA ligase n=1 Tax=hydrothermal vent metagenome TaxID=652676 RepID=A0A3B1BXK7_9ZZZZ
MEHTLADLDKSYDPKGVEDKWYKEWIDAGVFKANDKSDKPPYTIVIPPPNVTGTLHIGHALNNTLQDILIRYKRMDGYNTLWMPGMDHAGIATQNVVERQLMAENKKRQDLGREKFIERVWEWKAESGGAIVNQLKKLGSSCDWDRERFTMDEGLSQAVREVFVSLYEEGLIYKGQYMINWCPRCHTALSDLEVEHHEKDGHMWHIRYAVEGSDKEFVIATTRPETLLGDTAVAVHPDDERYKDVVGKNVILPIKERKIPVIADEYVDMEFGSGALKITPAHDPNDFDLGNKYDLERIKVIGDDGRMTEEAGAPYTGKDRFKARKMIVDELKERGLLTRIDNHRHAVGQCYRCHNIVEPNVSKQWFVKIAPLAEPAIKAVEDGRVRFVPKHWENTYFEWMRNIRDWCISRQIWWGHRIPAWTCEKCHELMVSREAPVKCVKCGHTGLEQESDVLDTWFSSALWPFSTMGWPQKTEALKTFYPTSTLVTSFDIIFFWVARMIMMGLKFTGEAPFKDVYIHALVRDADGQKMSKSKGNTIDPLEVVKKYGADSMRMTLTALAAQGRDIKLSEERIEGYRHFANKLWNASRFALMNLKEFDTSKVDIVRDDLDLADRWILSRLQGVIKTTRKALDEYKFNDAAHCIYQFVWKELCDWYLEMIKPRLRGDEKGKDAALNTLCFTLESALRLLHPIMPFLTEELWQKVKPSGDFISLAPFPVADESLIDGNVEKEMSLVMDVTVVIRNIRGEMGVKPSTKLNVSIYVRGKADIRNMLVRQAPFIDKLANANSSFIDKPLKKNEDTAVGVVENVEVFVDLSNLASSDDRRAKAEKELRKIEEEIEHFSKKLKNPRFVDKAPPEIVERDRAKLESYKAQAAKLKKYV